MEFLAQGGLCVSDEVLNSQHYKHSQSTEASDQYANTLQIIYLKRVEEPFCRLLHDVHISYNLWYYITG